MATRRVEDKNPLDFFALCMSALGQQSHFRFTLSEACLLWAKSGQLQVYLILSEL
jgi:hypothetical protein